MDEPAVVTYERLMRQVHALIDQGKGDSEEAEDLAELLDHPWYAMTDEEQQRMRNLSAQINRERDEREQARPHR